MSWYVYMLRCGDESLYTGITDDPVRREKAHNAGKGSRYTRAHLPVKTVYLESCADKSAALRRERQIKALARDKKLSLILSESNEAASQ